MDKSGDSPMNWDVEEFLRRFHILMDLGPLYWHEDGRRLLEITELDLSRTEVVEELRFLCAAHHQRGPEPDDARPSANSAVHVFKMPLRKSTTEVYVKISIVKRPKPGVYAGTIWSFKRWS